MKNYYWDIETEGTTVKAINALNPQHIVSFASDFSSAAHSGTGFGYRSADERAAVEISARAAIEAFQADAPAQAAFIERVRAGRPVFVRVGKPNASGRSFNYREGFAEAGVSVYRAWEIKGLGLFADFSNGEDGTCWALAGAGDWFICTGDVLPTRGSDGETLLANVSAKRTKRAVQALMPAGFPGFWKLAGQA